jgi:hypothetical protein
VLSIVSNRGDESMSASLSRDTKNNTPRTPTEPLTEDEAALRLRVERELHRVQDQLRHYRDLAGHGGAVAWSDEYWVLCARERTLQRLLRVGPFDDGFLGELLDALEAAHIPSAARPREQRCSPTTKEKNSATGR